MSNKPFDFLFKLLLMGDSAVGKTSLLFRFSDDAYTSTFISTTGIDFKIKTIDVDGKCIKLQIWDTAGQERFKTITKSYYRGAMGIMIVYDVTNVKSFENVKNWLSDIREHASADVEKVLVGNKCEMEDCRKISKSQGNAVAEEHEMYFLETSAKENINVDEAFSYLSKLILKKIKNQGIPQTVSDNRRIGGGNSTNNTSSGQRSCCSS